MDWLAVLLDQQDAAGNLAGRDLIANGVAKPLQGRGERVPTAGVRDSARSSNAQPTTREIANAAVARQRSAAFSVCHRFIAVVISSNVFGLR